MNQSRLNDIAFLLLRLTIGLCVGYFACQDVLGLFGGDGFQKSMDYYGNAYRMVPALIAALLFAKLISSLCLSMGILARFGGVLGAVSFGVKTFFDIKAQVAIPNLMLPIVLMVGCLSIALTGAGMASLDKVVFGKGRSKKA